MSGNSATLRFIRAKQEESDTFKISPSVVEIHNSIIHSEISMQYFRATDKETTVNKQMDQYRISQRPFH